MRRRLLTFLSTFVFRRALWLVPVIVALTWLAVRGGLDLQYDTSLASFLPPATPEALILRDLMGDYRKLKPVVVELRAAEAGHEVALVQLGRELARWLDNQIYFTTPIYKADNTGELQNLSLLHMVQLLPPEDWDTLGARLEALLRVNRAKIAAAGPAAMQQDFVTSGVLQALNERVATSHGPTRMPQRDGYFFSPDGRSLMLLVYPVLSPEDANAALNTLHFANRCRKFLFDQHPEFKGKISVNFSGSIITSGQHIEQMATELSVILRFAIALALLLFLLVFRKFEALLFVAIPPAIGLAWTLGLAHLFFTQISIVALTLQLIIVAIGLEYTIQLYYRFTLELYRTHNYYKALNRCYVETGGGLLASALLLGLLFLMLFLTSLKGVEAGHGWWSAATQASGFARLGLIACLGLGCNLLACLLALPLMAAVKHRLARGSIKPVPLYRFHLDRLFMPAVINPRATLIFILVAAVVLGYPARQLDFAEDFAAISPFFYRPAPAAELGENVADGANSAGGFPQAGRPIVAMVSGANLEEALRQNDLLEANIRAAMNEFHIFSYDSLRWELPAEATQRAGLERLRGLDLAALRGKLSQLTASQKLSPHVLDALFNTLRTAQQSVRGRPRFIRFTSDQNFDFIQNVQRHMARKNDRIYVATVIYPIAQGFQGAAIPALQRRLAQGVGHLTLVGDPVIERELGSLLKINLALLLLVSFFSVIITLYLHFRSVRRAFIALVPVIFTCFGLAGTMVLAGLQLNFFTLLALPLMLCVTLDHAIQFTRYFYDNQPCSVRFVMQAFGRVVVLSGGTLALFFGTGILTSHPGLRDFGAVVLQGLIVSTLAILMLLPALLQLFASNSRGWFKLPPDSETPQITGTN